MIASCEPWMIREDVLAAMNGRIAAHGMGDLARLAARPRSDSEDDPDRETDPGMGLRDMPPYTRPSARLVNGVAVIPVCGPIHRQDTYYNWVMSFLFGGVSCDQI